MGFGHGVGLCQWGAKQRALNGFDYTEILSYYYPGTKLEKDL
jgi:stage II sporulation protein D